MPILDSLISGGISGLAESVTKVAARFQASPTEKAKAKIDERKLDLEFNKLDEEVDARQTRVNMQEARHKSVFVAGWRPYVGWIAGTGFGIHVILIPVMSLALSIWAPSIELPDFDTVLILTILGAMLGTSKALRTIEKSKGVSTSSLRGLKIAR